MRKLEAMVAKDGTRLRELLHLRFSWKSHKGEWFDFDTYLQSNQCGQNAWFGQELRDPQVQVVGNTAVLRSVFEDRVDEGSGEPETFVMPMPQTWGARIWPVAMPGRTRDHDLETVNRSDSHSRKQRQGDVRAGRVQDRDWCPGHFADLHGPWRRGTNDQRAAAAVLPDLYELSGTALGLHPRSVPWDIGQG